MANKKEANSTCIICGKKYHLCVACERKKSNWKPWRRFVDKESCYNIYKVLNDYKFEKITKDEAKELLLNLDLSELDTFKENIKEKINNIMKAEKVVKSYKRKRKVDEQSENIVIDNISEEINKDFEKEIKEETEEKIENEFKEEFVEE